VPRGERPPAISPGVDTCTTFRSPEDRLGTGLGEGDRVLEGVEAGLEPMRHSTFRLPLSTGNFWPESPELWRIGELFLAHDDTARPDVPVHFYIFWRQILYY